MTTETISARDLTIGRVIVHAHPSATLGGAARTGRVTQVVTATPGVVYVWLEGGRVEYADLMFSHGDPVEVEVVDSRTYVVGLPVIVTVHDDGRVEYEVDTAEAAGDIWENIPDESTLTDEEITADQDRIEADHNRRQATGAFHVIFVPSQEA